MPCPGWVGSGSSVPARTKALEWNCPQLLLLLAGVGSQQRTNGRVVTGHWEIAGVVEAADPSALAPLPRLNSLRKPVSLCPNWEAGGWHVSPPWLGPNAQCPSDLHLGAGAFFLILFFVVVLSLLKTNFGFVSWK